MSYILSYVKNTAPIIITFSRQNVTLSVTVTNRLAQIHAMEAWSKWRRRRNWWGFASSLSDHLRFPISSRVRPFRRTSSHPFFWLRQMVSWTAPNGGEGGIRTPGTLSGTTDFESVTFGHSATSPKSGVRKSSRRALASTDYRSVSGNSPKSWYRNEQSR